MMYQCSLHDDILKVFKKYDSMSVVMFHLYGLLIINGMYELYVVVAIALCRLLLLNLFYKICRMNHLRKR